MSETTPPITLGAESVRAELAEAPEAHGLSRVQAERIAALPDSQINEALHAQLDDEFFEVYFGIRSDAITQLAFDPLVCVTFQDGQDYEDAVDDANALGGSTTAVVEHLTQWDYGDENDRAASVNGYTQLTDLEGEPHQLHEVDFGGLHYWLQLDHHLGFYALYRRPIEPIDHNN